jgi:leucyl-tRNA---protein transferase
MELARMEGPPGPCSYIPELTSTLEYRFILGMDTGQYHEMLRRGWRRFGYTFFRPKCEGCKKCQSLRVRVEDFHPTKSQRRSLKRNKHLKILIGQPSVSDEHLRLYEAYHDDMSQRRGWPLQSYDQEEYIESFVTGGGEFAREFRYFDNSKLVGVGLVDVLPDGLSSIYFFHDPKWRKLSPGVFSVLTEIDFARQMGLNYLYLGYWIEENQSMEYKGRYKPHEILEAYVEEASDPLWTIPKDPTFSV